MVEAATALSELVEASAIASGDNVSEKAVSPSPPPAASIAASTASTPSKDKKKEIFPERLMEMLSDKTLSDVITWTPNGRSFVILRPDILVQVLPKYLPAENSRASTKYPSFTRKLNRW